MQRAPIENRMNKLVTLKAIKAHVPLTQYSILEGAHGHVFFYSVWSKVGSFDRQETVTGHRPDVKSLRPSRFVFPLSIMFRHVFVGNSLIDTQGST